MDKACLKASGRMATRSVYKAAADAVIRNIDELGECSAGNRTYFHGKGFSSEPGMAASRGEPRDD